MQENEEVVLVRDIVRILGQVASALQYLHEVGYVRACEQYKSEKKRDKERLKECRK